MVAILSLLLILVFSILITRIATVALTHTGLSRQTARFQARSAFTGVGYTTTESERIVNHPVRRRIMLLLMLLGNAGIVSAMASLILSFVDGGDVRITFRIVALIAGVVGLLFVASSKWVDRRISALISRLLSRYTDLAVRDYEAVLHISGDYEVDELNVEEGDWLANERLVDLRLRDEGVQVLGITRSDGTFLGVPGGDTVIRANDSLLLYGMADALENLDEREQGAAGDAQHQDSVRRHADRQQLERTEDEAADDGHLSREP